MSSPKRLETHSPRPALSRNGPRTLLSARLIGAETPPEYVDRGCCIFDELLRAKSDHLSTGAEQRSLAEQAGEALRRPKAALRLTTMSLRHSKFLSVAAG
jgi:hypothetical protein